MTQTFERTLRLYDYALPQELVALAPAHPRDSAWLLVWDRRSRRASWTRFRRLADFLPKNAVLVFNETKVIPAAIELRKETGGRVRALYLGHEGGLIRTLAEGTLAPGVRLAWHGRHSFTVVRREGKEALLRPSFPMRDLLPLLRRHGTTPLPPYLKDSPLSERRRRSEYQTVFARAAGSVAAPTAGLHFTKRLLKDLRRRGIGIATVTLHVNLGTFAPLTEEQWKKKRLHTETYAIDCRTAALLNRARREGRPIVAVGTTTVRTLESAVRGGRLSRLSGATDLFLTEKAPPRFVDGLITNFHVPRSSLLMLVASFTGRKRLLALYKEAIAKKFRFFSFGDGMLIL